MAIPQMEDDVEVISKLGDTPGSDDGLTAQQLKGRFDLAGVRLKNFINNTLIPHLNQLVDVQALLNGILDSTLTLPDKAANAKSTGDKIAEALRIANAALPRGGGIMAGAVNMNNQQLTGLPAPVSASNAVPKSYVDTVVRSAKLTATGWSGTEAPFTQTVIVDVLTDARMVDICPAYSGTHAEELAMMEACACVSHAKRSGNVVTFTCLEYKPSVDIDIRVEVGV